MSKLCPRTLGSPPPPHNSQLRLKPYKQGLRHALHKIFDLFGWSKYQKKTSLGNCIAVSKSTSQRIYSKQHMLCISWMVTLGDQGIKFFSGTLIFELPKVKNCTSMLCTNPLGPPPFTDLISKHGKKHVNTA